VDIICPAWTQNVPKIIMCPENGMAAAFLRKTAAAMKIFFIYF
jgi:hypothetical protein